MTPDHDITSDLRRIADEIRVRIHLAGMDARDAWAKLEPRVSDIERQIDRVGAEAAAGLDKLVAGIHRELTQFRQRLFDS